MSLDYPPAHWLPGPAKRNYTPANRPVSSQIVRVSMHYTAGYNRPIIYGGAVSSHYSLYQDGSIDQIVREKDVAWADGIWSSNLVSISLEHEGFGTVKDWTDAMLETSARLVGNLSKKYKFPPDRAHVLAHSQINPGKLDPGRNFPWTDYMKEVVRYAGGGAPKVPKPPTGDSRLRLVLGSYAARVTAGSALEFVQAAGYKDAWIKPTTLGGGGLIYRIIGGSFSTSGAASEALELAKSRGFDDAWLDREAVN